MLRFRSLLATTAVVSMAAISPFGVTPLPAAAKGSLDRLNEAATVFIEIMDAPDKGIPQDLLETAHCIVIVPGVRRVPSLWGPSTGKDSYPAAKRLGAIGLPRREFV